MDIDLESRKRKQDGASTGESPTMKKVSSVPDFCKSMPLGEPFLQDVASAFENQKFIDKVTPSLNTIMKPIITQAINDAVANAVRSLESSVIKPLQEQNKMLRLQIKETDEIIQTKNELLEQKNKVISELQQKVDNLTIKIDDIEQYGRRTSVRMYNLTYTSQSEEACTETVVGVIKNLMKVDISPDDIERCHPVGKPNSKGMKPLIIKFKHYHTKQRVYKAKSNLKGNPHKIFLTEDLTKRNHDMVAALLTKVKSESIHSFWTIDGKIFFKEFQHSTPRRVFSTSEVLTSLPAAESGQHDSEDL
ncbi:MAG: hypothetical protein AB2693_27260 [Candidatus Thiodiazotropha sp.]